MNRLPVTLILLSLVFITACTSNEIGSSKDVNPDAVYFDYKVWGEEGREEVTVNLQYRMGGKNGTTLLLDAPSDVKLDGELIKVDSAKFSGAFYEVQKPVASFAGTHTIHFTDLNKKEYKEEFSFNPFSLEPDVPAVINRGELVFIFKGLEPVDYLTVVLTDTSFSSKDINDVDTVKNGRLVISAERLGAVVNGPINLQFIKEGFNDLKNTTKEGGKLYMSYGLKREFELKD